MKLSRETKHWTTGDLAILRANASLGAAKLAQLLGCSTRAIRMTAHRHRISLRTPGSRCGLVLGQPRDVSLASEIRKDLVSGRIDPEVIALRMQIDAQAELCPACGRRPVRVRATGLCVPCHKRTLIEKHHEAMDELVALREHNRVKQQAKRLRDAVRAEEMTCRA